MGEEEEDCGRRGGEAEIVRDRKLDWHLITFTEVSSISITCPFECTSK
jgi:hypothetical protein